jgi:hypothetical protein
VNNGSLKHSNPLVKVIVQQHPDSVTPPTHFLCRPHHHHQNEQRQACHSHLGRPRSRAIHQAVRCGVAFQMDGGELEVQADTAAPGVPEPAGAGDGAEDHRGLPAAGVRRRGQAPGGEAGRGRHRQRLSPARRGLRRELQGVQCEQHKGHLQSASSDGCCSYVRWSSACH